MNILGLDLSIASTGWALAVNREPRATGTFGSRYGADDRIKRLQELRAKLIGVVESTKPDVCLIEGYSFGSMSRAVYQVGEWGGVARLVLYDAWPVPAQTIEIPPSSVKKFVTGKGNADKSQMAIKVYKRWKVDFETSDEVDAFALAMMWPEYEDWLPKPKKKARKAA